MILISKIQIEGFRSIRSATIERLGDFTSISGLNNAGKSNLLRALNAFFNDETDPGRQVSVDADHSRPSPKKGKKKRITVGVTFTLPGNFRFRKGLAQAESLLGREPFSIQKVWTRDTSTPTYRLNGKDVGSEQRPTIEQFIRLIRYRYVPNRVLPTELIRNENQALRDVLIRRLAPRAKSDQEAFAALRDVSGAIVKSLSNRFESACPGQGAVTLATPTSWRDMAIAFGYRLVRGAVEMEDSAQGSGIQSLLMLETLYLIDQDYWKQFGWRQASIWGLEEPESSLHSTLEAHVASYLARVSSGDASRLQVLSTTHSDLIAGYSDPVLIAENVDGSTEIERCSDVRVGLHKLAAMGASRLPHALLMRPLEPLVLVEGRRDRTFFEGALRIIRPTREVRVLDLPSLTGDTDDGGAERLKQYLKSHRLAISARRPDAPVIVVLDWDAASRVSEFKKLDPQEQHMRVLAWPETSLNPRAGVSIRGIERCYSTRLLELARDRGAALAQKSDGTFTIQAAEGEDFKRIVTDLVDTDLQASDLEYAEPFVRDVLRAAGAEPPVPVSASDKSPRQSTGLGRE